MLSLRALPLLAAVSLLAVLLLTASPSPARAGLPAFTAQAFEDPNACATIARNLQAGNFVPYNTCSATTVSQVDACIQQGIQFAFPGINQITGPLLIDAYKAFCKYVAYIQSTG